MIQIIQKIFPHYKLKEKNFFLFFVFIEIYFFCILYVILDIVTLQKGSFL